MGNDIKEIKFTDDTELYVGEYFRAYKSKYNTLVKEIAYNQRNYEDGYGEYRITMIKVDIFTKKGKLLAENSIVPIDRLISGNLSKYIPNLYYDPTYLGNVDVDKHHVEHKIWIDMRDRCYHCRDKAFPYIGGVGTLLCDRWRCFEYFLADFKHILGYEEAKKDLYCNRSYIVDIYDIQRHIHPSKRIYAPGYVKLKPFKNSDICKYFNAPAYKELYPRDQMLTIKYASGEIDIKETLFKKQTGMNVIIDLDNADYYYNSSIGYQPLVAMINPYMSFAYNLYNNQHNQQPIINLYNNQQPIMKEMCTIIRKA